MKNKNLQAPREATFFTPTTNAVKTYQHLSAGLSLTVEGDRETGQFNAKLRSTTGGTESRLLRTEDEFDDWIEKCLEDFFEGTVL